LAGFGWIDMPMDWLGEDWLTDLSDAARGIMWRLIHTALRQTSPAGSLPGKVSAVAELIGRAPDYAPLIEALALWEVCSDGRRYWWRLVPVVESAWGRVRNTKTKDAERKKRQRLAEKLRECGLTDVGSRNRDVQDAVLAQMMDGDKITSRAVFDAATAAQVIGTVRRLSKSVTADSLGQSQDSPRTDVGQFSDSPVVSGSAPPSKSGGTRR
jgi:hypothetical protein